MNFPKHARPLMFAAAFLALVGCAGVKPVPYAGLPSSTHLTPNTRDDSDRTPYRYATTVNWASYSKVMVDPAVIYRGPDNQFGKMSDEDKATLADYLQKTFAQKLETRFQRASKAEPGTLRIKLVLTGAETTTTFLGQFTHFDIGGNLYNGVQAARGGQSLFGGSVSYAVEIYDASNDKLLNAYVTKQYPNAMNLTASFGSLGAAKVGIEKGADALVTQLR